MSPALKTVVANGIRFSYLEEGDGPLVLLVHGFPDTAHTWDAVRPALASAGFRAVSANQRGYAPTSLAPDDRYDSGVLGDDIAALIGALGEDQAIVVGHDWGASAAYAATGAHPDRVRLLITVAIPHPASIKPTLRLAWGGRHFLSFRLPGAASRVRARDFALIDELWRRWSPGWEVPRSETAPVKEAFRQPGSLEAAIAYYRALGARLPSGLRRRIDTPTVALAPENDGMLTLADYERARSRFEGPYRVIQVPGGHFPHRQHPEPFMTALLDALGDAPTL